MLNHRITVLLQLLGWNIPKWDCILNFCSYCPRIEQLDRLFPASLHKIKFHIFQKIYKCSIHNVRQFKYKNTCKLCDSILDKDKKGILLVRKCFVIYDEVIDVFHEKYYIPTIEKLQFHLAHVQILGSM